MNHGTIVLASASPRRTELMALAGIEFTVVAADICEDALPGEKPSEHVIRLSREKADAVARTTAGRFFIGADTVVVLDDTIMGKPADDDDAFRMLTALSGRNHEVITGFTVFDAVSGIHLSRSVHTEVTFRTVGEHEIRNYIASGCPRDKAGAYAIQGGAVHFVRSISGSYTNVVGLPMAELYEVLQTVEALP
ncbi:septum formation inhibitor Maf [Geobacter sp. FeAm09]|uniref:Maf family nucleotide pyrophosphatase n=1 Tax=Geobacter sp. FeAm09 TaxID=2597769 RepID=UPI0011F04D3D|nr:Maf family nucleotide pyrophosphatase [Geobacter sp. FeAm09]QEM66954.1 septum formation inhibitor Maf [Geobacter sp. FeAm09]